MTWMQPLPRVITRGRDNDQMLAKGPSAAVLSANLRVVAVTAPLAMLVFNVAVGIPHRHRTARQVAQRNAPFFLPRTHLHR